MWRDMDSVLILSEQATIENTMFDNPNSISSASVYRIASHVQALSLITTGLLRWTKLEEWQFLNQPAQTSEVEFGFGFPWQNYSRRIPMKSTSPNALMAAWDQGLAEIFADMASDFRRQESR